MEAEVVDPEEEKTAHYDYNAVRDKLKALDPEALAAAEAMFDDEDDEPATVMASQEPATVMAAPARRAPVVKNAIPGIRRSQPEPIAPPPESHPGTESLMDDAADDPPANDEDEGDAADARWHRRARQWARAVDAEASSSDADDANDDASPQRRIVVDVVAEVIQIQRFAGRRAAFVDGAASARRAVDIDAGPGRSRRGLVRVVHGDAPAHVGDV